MAIQISGTHWYWPVMLVLTIGYVLGGAMPAGIHYFGLLDEYIPDNFKPILYSFLFGLLGATVQMSIYFAKDVNGVMSGKQPTMPSCFEFFGYLLKMVWGGIAATFFILSVKLGFLAAVSAPGDGLRLPAIIVISFCAGLRAYQILQALAGIIPARTA